MTGAPEPSDEDLVRDIRRGDTAAAGLLVERHTPVLRAAVLQRLPRVLRPRVGPSDVVQETYSAAFLNLADFEDRGEGSFGRWLREILEHKIVDEIRRHMEVGKRDARRDVHMNTGQEPNPGRRRTPSPVSEVVAAEQADVVRGAVEDLPSDYRTVLRYLLHDGMTAGEAGERMGRSPEAVRKLYARALGRLADDLDDPRTTHP